jgi:hypothetical protein
MINNQIKEIAALYGQINLNEGNRLGTGTEIVGKISKAAAPVFKGALGIPTSQSLKDVAGKKAVELVSRGAAQTVKTGANIARATRDIVGQGIQSGGKGLKDLGMTTAKSMRAVAPTAAVAGVLDLAIRQGQSVPAQLYNKVKKIANPNLADSYQIDDETVIECLNVIANYLIIEKYASDEKSALKIMENMSEGWAQNILEDYLEG